MSDTNPTPAKPGTSTSPKVKATKATASASPTTPPPLINPAWATYVIKKEDVIGKTAELAVDVLTTAIQQQVEKATTPEKLEKIVWKAITEARRKARG